MQEYDKGKSPVIIGYYSAVAVYLLPSETWHELQRYCIQENSHFPFSRSTFFKILRERGLIEPTKEGHSTIQKKIEGKNQRVLKVIHGGIFDYFVTSATNDTTY